ncbi:MAG TPA: B12-binding domain-containing radical SAM protein [Verrucomicrobiae bacterium]|nr:B12-binding domain-containing radical SAM protein [Verrucomicrobiae bacterium]
MRVLLIAPRFARNLWTYERALALIGRKSTLPPLGLITVAALLPQDWEFRLVDRNVSEVAQADWAWAELILLSGMTTQREDFLALVREAKQRGKRVAVGGPYPTTLPGEVAAAGADYLALGEGELTIPAFVAALQQGEKEGCFSPNGEFADLSHTVVPRFDLLDLRAYESMSVQFSRGCPFRCEFCEIGVLFGSRARAKTPAQMLAEFDRLRELGWRRSIFVVDDNFVGNRVKVRDLLRELKPWQKRHGYPFTLNTEASMDLASDRELLDLMADCNFNGVFLGIETPDDASLKRAGKLQNTRLPLETAVETITRAGLCVMGSFILGFDGEQPGAGERICEFMERTSIPTTVVSMLQALPRTTLWERLKREGRLRGEDARLNLETLMNFEPTRPMDEIAREYSAALWQIYDPVRFLDRTYHHFQMLAPPRWDLKERTPDEHGWQDIRALLTLCWRQGIKRRSRWKFWQYLFRIGRNNPRVVGHYICTLAHLEHFLWIRKSVRHQVETQLGVHSLPQQAAPRKTSPRPDSPAPVI